MALTIHIKENKHMAHQREMHHPTHRGQANAFPVAAFTLLSLLTVTLSCGRTRSSSRFHSAASTVDSRMSSGLDDGSDS